MAGRIEQEWFDELFSRVNIEEIIGERISLIRKGQKLWACCPFHNEKTPSFSVDPQRGLYYCFGCHKGGNAITFLMEYDHMEKREAIEVLAERVHLKMPDAPAISSRQSEEDRELKEKISKQIVVTKNKTGGSTAKIILD